MLVATRNEKGGMTEFGKTLNKLMVARDVYNWKGLRALLQERVGYKVGQSGLSQYLHGIRNPREPRKFLDAISRTLDLNDEEKQTLILSFYESMMNSPEMSDEEVVTEENWSHADQFVAEEEEEYRTQGERRRGASDT